MATVSPAWSAPLHARLDIGAVQQNFVKVVRAVELILGIPVPGVQLATKPNTSNFTSAITAVTASANLTSIFNDEVTSALKDAVPILVQVGYQLTVPAIFDFNLASAPLHSQREPLVTK